MCLTNLHMCEETTRPCSSSRSGEIIFSHRKFTFDKLDFETWRQPLGRLVVANVLAVHPALVAPAFGLRTSRVVGMTDGDTIWVLCSGAAEKIRL